MKKNNRQSGQATMELLVLLIPFLACFLGLLLVMSLSLTNVEAFIDAKFKAESSANYADDGSDGIGRDIKDWKYTDYKHEHKDDEIDMKIPFLPKDEPVFADQGLSNFEKEFSDETDNSKKYKFHNFSKIDISIADNFPIDASSGGNSVFSASYKAAKLHEGKSDEIRGDGDMLMRNIKDFEEEKKYKAFETIIGVNIEDLRDVFVDGNYTNRVFYPAMQVLEKTGGNVNNGGQNATEIGPPRL